MERARRHQRALARLALILLALVAELTGRSLSHRLDFGQHVRTASYSGADYYPFLLAAVKVGVALMLLQRRDRRMAIPFGPFLAVGATCALFWGDALIAWYLATSGIG